MVCCKIPQDMLPTEDSTEYTIVPKTSQDYMLSTEDITYDNSKHGVVQWCMLSTEDNKEYLYLVGYPENITTNIFYAIYWR